MTTVLVVLCVVVSMDTLLMLTLFGRIRSLMHRIDRNLHLMELHGDITDRQKRKTVEAVSSISHSLAEGTAAAAEKADTASMKVSETQRLLKEQHQEIMACLSGIRGK